MRIQKSNYPLICLLTVIFGSSCSYNEQRVLLPELKRAEAVMYQYPDSTLRILEQMPVPASSDRLNHATWCLLLAQARYKNFIGQPSDSLIRIASDYFIEKDDPQRKALVLYLEGAISGEQGDTEKAIQLYLEAADEAAKTTDYQLRHLISAGLGQIYYARGLYEYAKEAADQSYDYAKLSGDKRYIANSLLLIGRLCSMQKDWNEVIKYYKEAIDIFDSIGDARSSGRIMLEMSVIYSRQEDYPAALAYAQKEFRLKTEDDPDFHKACLTIGDIFRMMGNADSAYYYFNKVILSGNIYAKKETYEALYYLSNDEKRYEEAEEYINQLQLCTDSIQRVDRTNAIIEIQEKYDKEKLLNEKNQLKIEKADTLRTALLIFIVLLCVVATVIYRLLQKERTIQKNEEQLRFYALKIHENEVLINRNENRIQELSAAMEQNHEMQELLEEQKNAIAEIKNQNDALRRRNESLQDNIHHRSSTPYERSEELDALKAVTEENQRLQKRERSLCDQLLSRITILNNLRTSPKYQNADSWKKVTEAIDELYENYTERLLKAMPSLTEGDLQVCCLIKLRLGIPEITIILGISPTSVSKRKQRLKERIMQELGEPLSDGKSLDLWLWEY